MTQSAPRSDQSDDEIMQTLALAINLYKSRFGEDDLIDCLHDLLITIEGRGASEIPVNPG